MQNTCLTRLACSIQIKFGSSQFMNLIQGNLFTMEENSEQLLLL